MERNQMAELPGLFLCWERGRNGKSDGDTESKIKKLSKSKPFDNSDNTNKKSVFERILPKILH